jgi:hypothetical protein
MRKRFYYILFTLSAIGLDSHVYSQMPFLDSLSEWSHPENTERVRSTISTEEIDDTLKGAMIRALCIRFSEENVDSALKYSQEFYLLCQKNKWLLEEAWSLDFMGAMHLKTGNSAKAIALSLAAMKQYEKLDSNTYRALNYMLIGDALATQNDPTAVDYYRLSLGAVTEDDLHSFYKTWTMTTLGNYYLTRGQLDSANYYALQAYQIFQSKERALQVNFKYYADCLNLLGRINKQNKNNTLALEYFKLSVKQAVLSSNLPAICYNYLDIASLYNEAGSQDSTIKYAKEAYLISQQLSNPYVILRTSAFLNDYYKARKEVDSAYKYLQIVLFAKDSVLSSNQTRQIHSLAFEEKVRQQELEDHQAIASKERERNLQYAAIAIGLLVTIILFLGLSRTVIVRPGFIKFFGILVLLAVFEFINLFLHPYLESWTDHSPFWILLILITVGAVLVPFHHKLEKWITHQLVEKNKRIRLQAAKKTIRQLEE